MIKNILSLLFLLLLGVLASAEDLTLTRIGVYGNDFTRTEVILGTFLEVAEGERVSHERLDEAARLAQNRLEALEYFSSVLVTVVVSKAIPGTARIVVEVVEGPTARLSAGTAWGMAGKLNWAGTAQDFALWLGFNRQAAGWKNNAPGWKGGSWTVEAGNDPADWTDSSGSVNESHDVGGSFEVSQALGWGWSATGSQKTQWELSPDYSSGQLRADQGARLVWDTTPAGFSPDHGFLVQAGASVLAPAGLVRQNADFKAYVGLGWGFKIAVRGSGATQQGNFGDRDAQVLSGIDGLRKPFDSADLTRTSLWTSAELRWAWPQWPFFGFTSFWIEPALIADAGQGWGDASAQQAWDAGFALRVFWTAPVDVPLRVETTLDNKNRWWTGFAIESPY